EYRGRGACGGSWFCVRQVFAVLATVLVVVQAFGASLESSGIAEKADQAVKPLVLEAFVDFVDDGLIAGRPITPQHIDALMRRLKEMGVRRVSWSYYGDGHGGFLVPAGYTGVKTVRSDWE